MYSYLYQEHRKDKKKKKKKNKDREKEKEDEKEKKEKHKVNHLSNMFIDHIHYWNKDHVYIFHPLFSFKIVYINYSW